MFLQDEQQVATVPSDNNWVLFVNPGLRERGAGEGVDTAKLSLGLNFKVCLY